MSYKCLECGHTFEDGEEGFYVETYEYWGRTFHDKVYVCPVCKGDYEPSYNCTVCGESHFKDDLISGVCSKCINKYKNDLNFCCSLSQDKTEIKINSLLASLLNHDEIEQILTEYILRKSPKKDFSSYIDDDLSWFAEEVKKHESCKFKQR